jgi:hypothetical protein
MNTKYRIFVIGDVPRDLKERIAAIHAAGILTEKNQSIPVNTRQKNDQNRVERRYQVKY